MYMYACEYAVRVMVTDMDIQPHDQAVTSVQFLEVTVNSLLTY